MIAALFVLADGPYSGLSNVDPWPESRDARLYSGPWPVVAHPPCERWSRVGARHGRIGEDGGCFASALASARRWGGVLEHPEGSAAYAAHGLAAPRRGRGWIASGGGMACAVAQGHYGHRATKWTWLLYFGDASPPDLNWGSHDAQPGATPRERRIGIVQRLSRRQRQITPIPFRDLLISLASASVPTGG